MPQINLCLLWHMHQPFYKDLVTGEYQLPWARLHALKDYYGMVKILEDFPRIHQTFNLVPSLLVQVEEYGEGKASDPFLQAALKPADRLSPAEKEFILQYFFQADEEHLIRRYPRYAELFEIVNRWKGSPHRALNEFTTAMLTDLQVLSQLAWFDEEYLQKDSQVARLAAKGRDFSFADQKLLGAKQIAAMRNVAAAYRNFAARGQIELSTTPFYHPIVPLLCDSNIASESHPYVPLPTRFVRPNDAAEQIRRSIAYFEVKLGSRPVGMWPSEGSVSDETLALAAEFGFRWIAAGEGILKRTVGEPIEQGVGYQPYLWKQDGREIHVFFRDQWLSNLIGFVCSKMSPDEGAEHFLEQVRRSCEPLLESGRDAVVPIILDGENAWESYFENGRPFLRELYSRISADPGWSAITMSEALQTMPAKEITHIFPGSWIDANFDIWIGSDEDNAAWEQLGNARETYDAVMQSPRGASLPETAKQMAYEELLIAEGSDWCWWYGPEHASVNRKDFDRLYRAHLANVYRLLGEDVPKALERTLLIEQKCDLHEPPDGLIQPVIDGEVTTPGEWQNAGCYRLEDRAGALHSQRSRIQNLRYGSDETNMYFRIDWREPIGSVSLEIRLGLRNRAGSRFHITARACGCSSSVIDTNLPQEALDIASGAICELRVSMSAIQLKRGESLFLNLAVYRDGVPVAILPASGELELHWSMVSAYAV